ADVELAHLPRGVGEHLLPRLQLHLEHRVGERLDDGGVHLDRLLLDLLDGRVARGTSVAAACRSAATRASGPGWTTSQASRCSWGLQIGRHATTVSWVCAVGQG